jgi:hypothetical protein
LACAEFFFVNLRLCESYMEKWCRVDMTAKKENCDSKIDQMVRATAAAKKAGLGKHTGLSERFLKVCLSSRKL